MHLEIISIWLWLNKKKEWQQASEQQYDDDNTLRTRRYT